MFHFPRLLLFFCFLVGLPSFASSYEKLSPKEVNKFIDEAGKCLKKRERTCLDEILSTELIISSENLGCETKDRVVSTRDEFHKCLKSEKFFKVLSECFIQKMGRKSKQVEDALFVSNGYVCYYDKEDGKIRIKSIILTD